MTRPELLKAILDKQMNYYDELPIEKRRALTCFLLKRFYENHTIEELEQNLTQLKNNSLLEDKVK